MILFIILNITKQNIKKFILIYTHNQKQLHLHLLLDLGFYVRSLLSLHIVIKRLLKMTNHPI
jgi:hypothetical protein